MRENKGPRKAGNILKGLLRSNPALRGNLQRSVAQILGSVLEGLVGEEASRCRLVSLARGVVTIGVDSAVIRHELQCFYTQRVLDELQARIEHANLRKVRFVVAEPRDGLDIGKQR